MNQSRRSFCVVLVSLIITALCDISADHLSHLSENSKLYEITYEVVQEPRNQSDDTSYQTQGNAHLVVPDGGLKIPFSDQVARINVKIYSTIQDPEYNVRISSSNSDIATVNPSSISTSPCESENSPPSDDAGRNITGILSHTEDNDTSVFQTCHVITFSVSTHWLGYSRLGFSLIPTSNRSEDVYAGYVPLICQRQLRPIDQAFVVVIRIMVALATFGMGSDIELDIIKAHLRRPKAPIIALLSQFTVMPLISYGLIYLMQYTGGSAIGIFLIGSAPGGGSSNMWCKLLRGDMSVSATMTTLSTLASIAMIPFWVYTLGSTIPAGDEIGQISIPFLSIVASLAFIIVPLGLGFLMKRKAPRAARIIRKCLKVLFLFIIIFLLTVGIYSNLYVFKSRGAWRVFLSSALLPYGGYMCGACLAWICRLEWKLIKTVSLETGMQNVGIAVLIVQAALKSPDSDLALIPAIAAAFMTSVPLLITLPFYLLYHRLNVKTSYFLKNMDNSLGIDEESRSSDTSGVETDGEKLCNDSMVSADKRVGKSELSSQDGMVDLDEMNDISSDKNPDGKSTKEKLLSATD